MSAAKLAVDSIRDFNRFYTKVIGLLDRHFLASPYSLTEARVIYELGQRGASTATAIRSETGLDAGYLSRILDSFAEAKLIERTRSPDDGRARVLSLTRTGRAAFAALDEAQNRAVEAQLARLDARQREELVHHMQRIKELLRDSAEDRGG